MTSKAVHRKRYFKKYFPKTKQEDAGFTLIEVLMAIAIMGGLSGIVFLAVRPVLILDSAQEIKRKSHIKALENSMKMHILQESYMLQKDAIPEASSQAGAVDICRQGVTDPSCVSLDTLVDEGLLGQIPLDPAIESDPSETVKTGYTVRQLAFRVFVESPYSEDASSSSTASVASSAVSSSAGSSASGGTGTGTQGDPYTIATCQQLQDMQNDTSAYYALVSDVDCTETTTWNSGAGFDPVDQYGGGLDGQGFTISNLYINRPAENYVGLLGRLEGGAGNMTLYGVDIQGGSYVGGLAGYSDNIDVDSITVSGTVDGGSMVGGLAGYVVDTVYTNAHATVAVSGADNVGGLLGYYREVNRNTEFASSNCSAQGNVTGTSDRVGGLVGQLGTFVGITNCHATGNVSSPTGMYVGGLVGITGQTTTIADSYATGTVDGASSVGGLVGFGYADIDRVYATGNVTATGNYAGGLMGRLNFPGAISDSYAIGAVTGGGNYTAGLIGYNSQYVERSYAAGTVNGGNYTGGIAGMTSTTNGVTDSFSVSTITAAGTYTGAAMGYATTSTHTNIYWRDDKGADYCYRTSNTNCTLAPSDSHFYSSSNGPLASWDFATVWQENADALPTLR